MNGNGLSSYSLSSASKLVSISSDGMPGSPTTLAGRGRGASPQIVYLPCVSTVLHSPISFPPITASGGGAGSLTPLDLKASSEFQCTYFLKHMWVEILDVLV